MLDTPVTIVAARSIITQRLWVLFFVAYAFAFEIPIDMNINADHQRFITLKSISVIFQFDSAQFIRSYIYIYVIVTCILDFVTINDLAKTHT